MEFYEKMYTEDQLVRAYKRGFSNGIGISNPGDKRYDQDADKLAQDALNSMIPGGLTDESWNRTRSCEHVIDNPLLKQHGSIATYKTNTKSNR